MPCYANGMLSCYLSHTWDLILDCIQRSQLVGQEIEFPEYDLLTPHPPLGPYMVSPWGQVLEFRVARPLWARYPKDVSSGSQAASKVLTPSHQRQLVHTGTQTEDADTTLVEIEGMSMGEGSDIIGESK